MSRDPFADVSPCPHALPLPRVVPCARDCDVIESGCHVPGCPWFDAACDAASLGPGDTPPECGPSADEYEWMTPDGPEDPDRSWAHRDSGD